MRKERRTFCFSEYRILIVRRRQQLESPARSDHDRVELPSITCDTNYCYIGFVRNQDAYGSTIHYPANLTSRFLHFNLIVEKHYWDMVLIPGLRVSCLGRLFTNSRKLAIRDLLPVYIPPSGFRWLSKSVVGMDESVPG